MTLTGFQSGEKKMKENNTKSSNYNAFQATIDCVFSSNKNNLL